ncbi:MAG: hypothetical protein IPF54_02805 [Draconibacterium sp.]|nr:hypothetical protein [Draconibacterium sp.]
MKQSQNHYPEPPMSFDEQREVQRMGNARMASIHGTKELDGWCEQTAIVYGTLEEPERKRKTLSD